MATDNENPEIWLLGPYEKRVWAICRAVLRSPQVLLARSVFAVFLGIVSTELISRKCSLVARDIDIVMCGPVTWKHELMCLLIRSRSSRGCVALCEGLNRLRERRLLALLGTSQGVIVEPCNTLALEMYPPSPICLVRRYLKVLLAWVGMVKRPHLAPEFLKVRNIRYDS